MITRSSCIKKTKIIIFWRVFLKNFSDFDTEVDVLLVRRLLRWWSCFWVICFFYWPKKLSRLFILRSARMRRTEIRRKTLIKRSKSIKASLDHLPPIVSELDVLRNQWICLLSNTKSVWLVYRKCIA